MPEARARVEHVALDDVTARARFRLTSGPPELRPASSASYVARVEVDRSTRQKPKGPNMPNEPASDRSLANLIAEARSNFIRRTADVVDGHEEALVDAWNESTREIARALDDAHGHCWALAEEVRTACAAATLLHVERSQLRHALALANNEIERREREQAAVDTLVECVRRAGYARPRTRSLTADELEAEHDLRIALDAFESP